MDADGSIAGLCKSSVLPAAESDSGREEVRRVRRRAVRAVLCQGSGTARTGAGNLLSVADGRLLRGHRFGARHRLARQRQLVDPIVRADRAG